VKIGIIYYRLLDLEGRERTVGGVQTYLWNLACLVAQLGHEPLVVQAARIPFERKVGPVKVIGVVPGKYPPGNLKKELYRAALSHLCMKSDLLIFGADHVSVPVRNARCVSIQHGVSWDLPASFYKEDVANGFRLIPASLKKKWVAHRSIRYFRNCPNRVCVDYNFINWYRTQVTDEPDGNTWIIPNFAALPSGFAPALPRAWSDEVRIIFARRFVRYRGLHLMVAVAKTLLERNASVRVCFAGEGPDEAILRNQFGDEPRVSVVRYPYECAVTIHTQYDIAVIPSLGSEGTSLSLAEAMASGCAVVATNVGGMTSMIIDGYNGLLVSPSEANLLAAVEALAEDADLRTELGSRASETAQRAFSKERWERAWTNVFTTLQRG